MHCTLSGATIPGKVDLGGMATKKIFTIILFCIISKTLDVEVLPLYGDRVGLQPKPTGPDGQIGILDTIQLCKNYLY